MRVVVDTNVLVSAVFRDGDPQAVIHFVSTTPGVEWVGSTEIVAEYLRVISQPKFGMAREVLDEWRDTIARKVRLFPLFPGVDFPPDPDDAKFLACSLSARAEYLVTGDRRLLDLVKFGETAIVSIRAFRTGAMAPASPGTNGT